MYLNTLIPQPMRRQRLLLQLLLLQNRGSFKLCVNLAYFDCSLLCCALKRGFMEWEHWEVSNKLRLTGSSAK